MSDEQQAELIAVKRWGRVRPGCPCCGRKVGCESDCPHLVERMNARGEDRAWFDTHPAERMRQRDWTVGEQVGRWIATGELLAGRCRVVQREQRLGKYDNWRLALRWIDY